MARSLLAPVRVERKYLAHWQRKRLGSPVTVRKGKGMNPLDLLILGVYEGYGQRDYHSGGWVVNNEVEFTMLLRRLGIYRFWTLRIGKGWLA